MADLSGPIRRNHAILSKKLSNVHSFAGKSIYGDVFATSSMLKAPTFSSRVDDYAEIFNRSSSSSASSVPVLDLPDIDKLYGSANVPSSESDYSSIFGGFNDVDINLAEEVSTETRIPAKSNPSESDTDSLEKNQSVDGKKEFKMSYNKINIGVREGTPGTTHITQLHASPGFTCIIDEITPLQKTELPSTNDGSSFPGVSEVVVEKKHSRQASSNFSDSDFKDPNEKPVKAYDMDVNAGHPKVMPSSSPTPSLSNSNSSSVTGTAPKYETHESDDFESKIDESPVFSDEEVDTDSAATASATAVRKAIEMAQTSIRLAKEAMERHKSFQGSIKHSSKKRLKVKEVRDNKMSAEVKIVSEREGLEICERELTTNQNFPCMNWQNESSGNQSDVHPVKQDRSERKGDFKANKFHGREEVEKNLEVSQEVETEGKFYPSQEPEIFEEVLTEFLEHAETENESINQKSSHDDYDTVLNDSQKQLETELKLEPACEGERIENKLKDYVGEEKERKVNELLSQEIYEREAKEGCESLENEEKPTSSCEGDVNKDNLQDAWTTKNYESGLETVHDQKLKLYEFNGGKASDNSLEEDSEREGFEKHDGAWKQEENDKAREEADLNDETEGAEDEKNLNAAQDSNTNTEKSHQKTYDDNVEATHKVLADKMSYMILGATETSSEPEENEASSSAVEMTNELADTEMYGESSLDQDAIAGDGDQISKNVDDASDVPMFDDDEVSETKADENEFKVEDVEYEWEAKYMLETASISEDDFEQNDIENSLKDVRGTKMVDDSDLSLDEASEDSDNEKIDKNNIEYGISCNVGACVENVAHEFREPSNNIKEDGAAFDQVEEINLMKEAYVDNQGVENEKIMEAALEIKTGQNTEQTKENLNETRNSEEKEVKERIHADVIDDKEQFRNSDKEKKKEREIERGRVAVERAIREARERAFVEARERAEKASVEKATAEAQQRLKKDVRERLDKAAAEANSLAAKVSMEAKAKAERAAVERATEEARGRALEKALSEKTTFEAREQQNDGTRRTFSSSDQHQGSGPSSSYKHSNSSNNGAHSPTERSDDGAKNESAERCKARLEKHQQIVERAAKALEEKNKRDLLVQKEQAERNRYADTLDSDVKRWSSGKTGNLRALLSTLQYILGADSGWQPVLLTDIVTNSAVKKAYRKATLFVHPDKLQQRRASIQQKYICEKVFDLLKEAWNKFNSEER